MYCGHTAGLYRSRRKTLVFFKSAIPIKLTATPLMQVTGVIELFTKFNVVLVLLSNETEASFKWAITQLRRSSEETGIMHPYVCIGDFDKSLSQRMESRVSIRFSATLSVTCNEKRCL